jgi:hypothetical protein
MALIMSSIKDYWECVSTAFEGLRLSVYVWWGHERGGEGCGVNVAYNWWP